MNIRLSSRRPTASSRRTIRVTAALAAVTAALAAGSAAAPAALGSVEAGQAPALPALAAASAARATGSVFVTGSGLADIVVEGPHHSLLLYWATPGSNWNEQTVAGPGTTYSDPAVFVRAAAPGGETDIVAEGPHNSLRYYYASTPQSPWTEVTVAGNHTTYSAPSIYVRDVAPLGEADIVAQGPHHSLYYEWARVGGSWNRNNVAPSGSTYQ